MSKMQKLVVEMELDEGDEETTSQQEAVYIANAYICSASKAEHSYEQRLSDKQTA